MRFDHNLHVYVLSTMLKGLPETKGMDRDKEVAKFSRVWKCPHNSFYISMDSYPRSRMDFKDTHGTMSLSKMVIN